MGRDLGRGEVLNDLYEIGVSKIELTCIDSLKELDDVVDEVFPDTRLLRYTIHLKRNILSDVLNDDKGDATDDLRQELYCGTSLRRVAESLCKIETVLLSIR